MGIFGGNQWRDKLSSFSIAVREGRASLVLSLALFASTLRRSFSESLGVQIHLCRTDGHRTALWREDLFSFYKARAAKPRGDIDDEGAIFLDEELISDGERVDDATRLWGENFRSIVPRKASLPTSSRESFECVILVSSCVWFSDR